MPTYEYACTECGERVEVFQRISDEPLRVCAACGGVLRKLFHPAGIVFKGSGFYSTDNRSPSSAKGGRKAEGSSSGEEGPKAEAGKGEAKASGAEKAKEKSA